jgi:hypothetical protein
MVLSDADLEEAKAQFYADTGEDAVATTSNGNVEADQGADDRDQDGGGRDLSLGALSLLAVTVAMAFF